MSKSEASGTRVVQRSHHTLVDWCVSHGIPRGQVSPDTIQDFYHASATNEIKAGFFAKRVVLVEGQTEALSLPVYLAAAGLDCSVEGVAVVPVGGKGNLPKWWRIFTAYEIPTYVVFDNDEAEDADARRRRDLLATLNEADPDEVLKLEDFRVHHAYAVFGSNFEECLRDLFAEYGNLERETKQFLRSGSKPLVARRVARHLVEQQDLDDPGWERFNELVQAVNSVTVP